MKPFWKRNAKNTDLSDIKENINSGYSSQREPAVGNAIVKMIEDSRKSGRGSLIRDIVIIVISLLSLGVSVLAYLKLG